MVQRHPIILRGWPYRVLVIWLLARHSLLLNHLTLSPMLQSYWPLVVNPSKLVPTLRPLPLRAITWLEHVLTSSLLSLWGWTQMYSSQRGFTWCPPLHALSLGFIFFTASVWSCCCFLAHCLFMRAGLCLVPSRCSINNFWISVVERNLYGARATQQASKDNLLSSYGRLMILIWLLERERIQKSQCLHFPPVVQTDDDALNSRVSKPRNSKSSVPAVQPDSPNVFMFISISTSNEKHWLMSSRLCVPLL